MSSHGLHDLSYLYQQRFLNQHCDLTSLCICHAVRQSPLRQEQTSKLALDAGPAIEPNDDRSLHRLLQFGYHCSANMDKRIYLRSLLSCILPEHQDDLSNK